MIGQPESRFVGVFITPRNAAGFMPHESVDTAGTGYCRTFSAIFEVRLPYLFHCQNHLDAVNLIPQG